MKLPKAVLDHHLEQLEPLIQNWNESSQVPPVLLLTGISGVGKKEMATYLANWLLCENQTEEDSLSLFGEQSTPKQKSTAPCFECANCKRFESGNHLDFQVIRSAEDKSTIKIEQFRELKSKQGFGASQSSYKVTLIEQAEEMTPQAANSLLKILEEPPKGWIFILTASNEKLLLPTLVSRCQKIKLKPLQTAAILNVLDLNEIKADQAQMIAEVSSGSWKKALSMTESTFWTKRKQVFDFLKTPQEHLSKIVDWASQNQDNIEFLCEQLEWIIHDLLRHHENSNSPWKNRDQSGFLTRLSTEFGTEFFFKQSTHIATIRKRSTAPLNKKLLVQDLLMPWLR